MHIVSQISEGKALKNENLTLKINIIMKTKMSNYRNCFALAYVLLVAVLFVGCKRGKEIPKVVKIKYYTSFSGDLMPNGICRYFYQEREGDLDYIETQEKCGCYNVGDTIR